MAHHKAKTYIVRPIMSIFPSSKETLAISFLKNRKVLPAVVVCRETEVERLVQVSWSLEDPDTRKREISGLLEAARDLSCSDLTIVTHDEEGDIVEKNRRIRIVPAWKFCNTGLRP